MFCDRPRKPTIHKPGYNNEQNNSGDKSHLHSFRSCLEIAAARVNVITYSVSLHYYTVKTYNVSNGLQQTSLDSRHP